MYKNLDSVIFGEGYHIREYIVFICYFANGEVIESCGVIVIELLKMLCRNGVSSSIAVVAS